MSCHVDTIDLRRMFEDKNTAVRAEKLSHILEALEKLKVAANSRYESAFGQVRPPPLRVIAAPTPLSLLSLSLRHGCFSSDHEVLDGLGAAEGGAAAGGPHLRRGRGGQPGAGRAQSFLDLLT